MKNKIKGIGFCLLLSIPAWYLGKLLPVVGGPVFAIIIGIIMGHIVKNRDSLNEGIAFTSKKILQYAVILLGFGLNMQTVIMVGGKSLPIILSTITTSLVLSFVISKALHIPGKIATLVGVGSSICGGSAIAATAPVIDADDDEIAQAISVIFFFNVIAALIFPTLGDLMGLSNEGFALFAGTAVNDTSSVTATASAWDSMHNTGSMVLDAATVVKLTRTLAIIPITLFLAFYNARKNMESKKNVSIKNIFPMFIAYFVLASLITTATDAMIGKGIIGAAAAANIQMVFSFLKKLSKFFIVMAMSAIGFNTNIVKLIKTGKKPLLLGFCCWVGIGAVSLLLQHALGIL